VVGAVRSAACTVVRYAIGPISVTRVNGDALLLAYRAEQDTTCGSSRVPSPVWVTSLYAKRAGRWLNVLFQQTPAS